MDIKPRDGIFNINTNYHINCSFLAWASKFYTRTTLLKHFGVNKLSNILKSKLIKLQSKNFDFIKPSRVLLFGLPPRNGSSSAHALNCLFLSRFYLKLFYTGTCQYQICWSSNWPCSTDWPWSWGIYEFWGVFSDFIKQCHIFSHFSSFEKFPSVARQNCVKFGADPNKVPYFKKNTHWEVSKKYIFSNYFLPFRN